MRSTERVQVDGEWYVPVWWVEHAHGRNHRTVRTWIREGVVRSAKVKGVRYVHYGDVIMQHQTRPRVLKSSTGAQHAQKQVAPAVR